MPVAHDRWALSLWQAGFTVFPPPVCTTIQWAGHYYSPHFTEKELQTVPCPRLQTGKEKSWQLTASHATWVLLLVTVLLNWWQPHYRRTVPHHSRAAGVASSSGSFKPFSCHCHSPHQSLSDIFQWQNWSCHSALHLFNGSPSIEHTCWGPTGKRDQYLW